jgi:16S rRNA processing protein RimM
MLVARVEGVDDRLAAEALRGVELYVAGGILEIAPPQGGETLLFPFTKAAAPIVDVAGGRMVIAPPVEDEGEAS